MADITYTNTATDRRNSQGLIPGKGDAHNVKVLCSATIELAASAPGTTVSFGRIPTTARILGQGLIYTDDLATTGLPTLDVGLGSVGSNVTSDPVAINNGLVLSSATTTTSIFSDLANAGKTAWSLAGATSDPGGEVDVYGSVKDAATTQTGTVMVELYGYID